MTTPIDSKNTQRPAENALPDYLVLVDDVDDGFDFLADAFGQPNNAFLQFLKAEDSSAHEFYQYAGLGWEMLPSGKALLDASNLLFDQKY